MPVNTSWHADYPIHAKAGAVLSLAVLLLAAQFPTGERDVDVPDEPPPQERVDLKEVAPTAHAEKTPAPPSPVPPVEVPNDEIVEGEPVDFDQSIEVSPETSTETVPPPPEKEEARNEPFKVVEEMPELVGGMKALYEKVTYPTQARRAGIEGTVRLQFVVTPEGAVTDVTVVNRVHPSLARAAEKAVKDMTFKPGRQRGRAVPVQMTLPIHFRLK